MMSFDGSKRASAPRRREWKGVSMRCSPRSKLCMILTAMTRMNRKVSKEEEQEEEEEE